MPSYRCPKCKLVAVIEGNKIQVELSGHIQSFPAHRDCELGKPLNEIDTSKLQKLS